MNVGVNLNRSIEIPFMNASRDAGKWWSVYGQKYRPLTEEEKEGKALQRESLVENLLLSSPTLTGKSLPSDEIIEEELPYKSYSPAYAEMSVSEYLEKQEKLNWISPFGIEKPTWFTEMSKVDQDAFIYTYAAIREDFVAVGTLKTYDTYRVGALYGMAEAKINLYEQTVGAENSDKLREYADFYLDQVIQNYGGMRQEIGNLDKNSSFFTTVADRFSNLGKISESNKFQSAFNALISGLENDAANMFYGKYPNAPTDPNYKWKEGVMYTSPIGLTYISAYKPIVENWNAFISALSETLGQDELRSYIHAAINTKT